MTRSTPDDGDAFVRRYLDGDVGPDASAQEQAQASTPRSATLSPRFEERRRWATTTLAAFGIATGAGTLFALAGAFWGAWPLFVKTAFLVAALALAHGGGTLADRRDEPLLAHFLYCLGAATFIGGVLSLGLRLEIAEPARREFWASAFPPAALLVFATAQTSRSRSLQFIAAATFVAAFALDGGERRILLFRFADWAIVCCALGEYWAWRQKSLGVAFAWLGVCVWTLVALVAAGLAFDARVLILICVFGLFQRWFGATLRSAFGATLGVFIVLCSLGLTAFPSFWSAAFATSGVSPFGLDVASAATLESSFAAALFIVFSTRLIFDGARQNVVQFALAIVVLALWVLAQCVVAALSFEANRFSAIPATVAALVFAALFVKIQKARPDDATLPPTGAAVVPDALNDDGEFDDLFDAEARAGIETPRLSSLFESLDAFWKVFAQRCRFPAYVASVLAQAIALGVFALEARAFL